MWYYASSRERLKTSADSYFWLFCLVSQDLGSLSFHDGDCTWTSTGVHRVISAPSLPLFPQSSLEAIAIAKHDVSSFLLHSTECPHSVHIGIAMIATYLHMYSVIAHAVERRSLIPLSSLHKCNALSFNYLHNLVNTYTHV